MSRREEQVAEFHEAFNHAVGVGLEDNWLNTLRLKLLEEELQELAEEVEEVIRINLCGEPVPVGMKVRLLKEMADLQYVLSGAAVAWGLPIADAFDRVHASNMSKLGEDGEPIYREDGKVLKGPSYTPPVLDDLIVK